MVVEHSQPPSVRVCYSEGRGGGSRPFNKTVPTWTREVLAEAGEGTSTAVGAVTYIQRLELDFETKAGVSSEL